MYENAISNESDSDALREQYAMFLRDSIRFGIALARVLKDWPIACEQFLSNDSINRIAWLGQASMFLDSGVPRKYRSGFMLLNANEQRSANLQAAHTLKQWERNYARTYSGISHPMDQQRLFEWDTR